jgi:hypothetical protein
MPIALGAMDAKVVLPILPGPAMTILGARILFVREMDERSKAIFVSLKVEAVVGL